MSRFFDGPAFPTFALALLALYEGLLLTLWLLPPADSGLGAFAAEFRVWCLSADPATGRANPGAAVAMLAPPLFLATGIAWFWWQPLTAIARRPRAVVIPAVSAVTIVASLAAVPGFARPEARVGELPFPAEALRTEHAPPPLRLLDQEGGTIDLAAFRGKVVLLTAVYASCTHTCPLVVSQAKQLVAGLTPEQQADLRVVAVTLDPLRDTRDVLATLAATQALRAPLWHFVTGDPPVVERTLDSMSIARSRDPDTGAINHANLFLLVDRQGRLAYRFTLGPRQARWLATAVRILLGERIDA